MSDLISRANLMEKAFTYEIGEKRTAKVVFLSDVQKAKAVDAVEVVRCKNCKYKGWIQEPCHGRSVDFCHVWDCTLRNTEKTFCSYGKRKEVSE